MLSRLMVGWVGGVILVIAFLGFIWSVVEVVSYLEYRIKGRRLARAYKARALDRK